MPSTETERIYVGGLDPPRLKPSDVVKRLHTLAGLEIASTNYDDDKAFFHVNATSSEPNMTALELVTKNYNNVRWKGCKLSVEASRPHILERLELERQERATRTTVEQQQQVTLKQDDEAKLGIPRRLRIRQMFGAAAHRVDTKPCETTDWNSFEKVLYQMNKRRDRKQVKSKASKTESFYNRAVHIKFENGWEDMVVTNGVNSKPNKKQINEDDESVSSSEDSNDSDSSTSDDGTMKDTVKKAQQYDWSSDDSDDVSANGQDDSTPASDDGTKTTSKNEPLTDGRTLETEKETEPTRSLEVEPSDDESSEDESDDVPTRLSETEQTKAKSVDNELPQGKEYVHDKHHDGDTSSDTDDSYYYDRKEAPQNASKKVIKSPDTELPQGEKHAHDKFHDGDTSSDTDDNYDYDREEAPQNASKKVTTLSNASSGYQWSSDEEDDSGDEKFAKRPAEARELSNVSEFAAAIDFDDDSEDDEPHGNTEDFDSAQQRTASEDDDLQQDVETNLDVLSQLFPDLKNMAPKQVEAGEVKRGSLRSTGAMMQRYDPTKESAQQFELEKATEKPREEKGENESSEDESAEESEDESDNEDDENKGKPLSKEREDDDLKDVTLSAKAPENVYHEAKLEEVFRKARDSGEGGGFQVSSMFGEQPDELKEKELQKKKGEAAGSFSFNFEVAPVAENEKKGEPAGEGFSFGFNVGAGASNRAANTEAEQGDEATGDDVETEAPARKRRRGLLQPDDAVVDKYYHMFFELNDGVTIQKDPEGFRNDEGVRAEWKADRHQLTQDWKRKRKYAMSRLQKKNKFR